MVEGSNSSQFSPLLSLPARRPRVTLGHSGLEPAACCINEVADQPIDAAGQALVGEFQPLAMLSLLT